MSSNEQSLANKLESLFLSILRIVILIGLTISIVGAFVLGGIGLMNQNSHVQEYEVQKFETKDLKEQLLNILDDTKKESKKETSEPEKKTDKRIDAELNTQVNVVSTFLKRYELVISDEENFKKTFLKNAYDLSTDSSDEGILNYLREQTDVLKIAFNTEELLKKLDPIKDSRLDPYYEFALSYHDNFYHSQYAEKEKNNIEQQANVIANKAKSSLQLYIAGALFGIFLLISLILVLVKIERNLRNN